MGSAEPGSLALSTTTAQQSFFVSPESEHHQDVVPHVKFPKEDQQILAAMEMLNRRCMTQNASWAEASSWSLWISLGEARCWKDPTREGQRGPDSPACPGVDVVCSLFLLSFLVHISTRSSTNSTASHKCEELHSTSVMKCSRFFMVLSFCLPFVANINLFLALKLTSGSWGKDTGFPVS